LDDIQWSAVPVVIWQQTNLDDGSKLLTALLLADQKIANTSCNSFASGRPKDY
jgi:hypothetical protein